MIQTTPIKAVPMATTPNASENASALAPDGESRFAISPILRRLKAIAGANNKRKTTPPTRPEADSIVAIVNIQRPKYKCRLQMNLEY
jgi:hypothetical protein